MSSTVPTRERLACTEEALAARCELAWVLLVLACASAVAGRLEPALGGFWDWAAVIATGAAALAGSAALGARHERDSALDAMLIAAPMAPAEGTAAARARRIASPRSRSFLAARLEALVVRSARGGRSECFQTGLVRIHATRLRAIAAQLRTDEVPVSAIARIQRLLADPASPLVGRHADVERFAVWVRQIEIDLASPVPVSSRRAFDRPQARPDRGGAALLRPEPARGRVPGQADGRGRRLRRQGADAGGRHRR